jgi:hypothetical protein
MERRDGDRGGWKLLRMGEISGSLSGAKLAADLTEPSLGMAFLRVYCMVLNTPRVGLALVGAFPCGVGEGGGGGERLGRFEN